MNRSGKKVRAVAALLGLVASVAMSAETVQVRIDSGELRGTVSDGVRSFKGIPFAQPPVGELRWRAPQPVKPWRGVRDATQFGPDCMQIPFPADAAPLGSTAPSEDCLYVNVWAPAELASKPLPVMVWIYGGGFVNGGTSPAVYDGSEFARSGVVLVSFNYRLGRFGFFAHPALFAEQGEPPTPNFGLLDQVAALEWVQRNVSKFGGDPGNVTIFGESAGGISVHVLLTTPRAEGLFHKAIIQSGGGRPGVIAGRPLGGPAEATGVALAQANGIEGTDAAALAKLRALPASALAKGLNLSMRDEVSYVGGPVEDGWLVRGAPSRLHAAGEGARVPVMVGATDQDIGWVDARNFEELYAEYGERAERARSLLDPSGRGDFRAVSFQAGGDRIMVEPARHVARLLSARGQPVYLFRFSYVAESRRNEVRGAEHATDIPFAFNTVKARYGEELTAKDAAVARALHDYWVSFARTGVPAAQGQPAWPRYTKESDVILDFTADGPVARPDPWRERLDLAEHANDLAERTASGGATR